MAGRMILYRGCLKSCNYHCSYCPFSKHPISEQELAKDREQWFSFVEKYKKQAGKMGIRAMMVVPYGEALIHPWYWEGLAHISALAETDAVGAQTNLSFSVQKSVKNFVEMGGKLEKLRIWATFHPEMTTVSDFAEKCRLLSEAGVSMCAGSVGVPENLKVLRQLKACLPSEVYLWVNKMDGLKRPYTAEEKEAFGEVDPYFIRELTPVLADAARCRERLFVEGDGKIRTCNISPVIAKKGIWVSEIVCRSEAMVLENGYEEDFPAPECNRKFCSCYLAYGGREDGMNRILFGEYPLFRIPRRPKAVFFDVDGTLLPAEESCTGKAKAVQAGDTRLAVCRDRILRSIQICEQGSIMAGLEALARDGTGLFFATTLPCEEVMKRCHNIRHLFRGGIFAGGAHIRLESRESFLWLEKTLLPYFVSLQRKYGFRILVYGKGEQFYKLTLLRSNHKPWMREEAEEIFCNVPIHKDSLRFLIEGKCLQVISAKANKAEGVKRMCQWLGISPQETAAVGDSEEDAEMITLCSR